MATKKITDLTLISSVTDSLSIPSDDGSASYRFTGAQLKTYLFQASSLLLATLDPAIFSGSSAVAIDPAADYLIISDVSDSGKTKKALAGGLNQAVNRSVTTTDAVGATDETMYLSGNSFTSTLPTAVGVTGKKYKYIHKGTSLTQVYTLATTSGQTIGGVASGSYALYTNGEVLHIESDGANWNITGHYAKTDWSSPVAVTLTGVSSNPTKGTMTNDYVQWRRDGRICHKRYRMYQSAAGSSAAGSGDYLFGLLVTPDTNATTGISVNTASATLVNNGASIPSIIPGSGYAYNVVSATTHTFLGPIFFLYSTTAFRVSGRYDTSDANIDSTHIAANGTSSAYSFDLSYPANGWQP